MAELMNREDFRAALENAIKGKSANQAPFSKRLGQWHALRDHLAPLGREPLSLRGPVRRLPGLYLRAHAGPYDRGQGLPAGQYGRGRDWRRPPHRPADPLCRSLRHHPRARGGCGQHVADHARPAKLVLRRGHARRPGRGRGRPGRGPGVAGAVDLPQADAHAARESTASPTRKSSSSTCTSSPTRSTASAATRSCWSTPIRRNCSSVA